MRRVGGLVGVLLVGCGSAAWPSFGDSVSIGDETDGEDELDHGVVKVQFARAEAEEDTPFVGTAQITITMSYDACFSVFYDENPSWTAAAVDGAPIFGTVEEGGEAWKDRLCDPPDPNQAACSVVQFQQELGLAKQLTVTYAVPENPENHFLKFGPLPLIDQIPEFTCDNGPPRVQIDPQQIQGYDGNGALIWWAEALDEDMAAPNQAKAVVAKVARND